MLHYETFRQTLVHVKAWAKRRGIYGSIMGYPGGVAWTILTAHYCRQRWQNGGGDGLRSPPTVGSVLSGFFKHWAEWPWPQPVELQSGDRAAPAQRHPTLDAEVWQQPQPDSPGSASSSGIPHSMPILSPVYPQMSTTYTVSAATFRVITEELRAAAQLSASGYSLDEWLALSAQQDPVHRTFLRQYPSYLRVEVSAEMRNARRAQWFALAKAFLRHIANRLEATDELETVHLFPTPFDPSTMDPFQGGDGGPVVRAGRRDASEEGERAAPRCELLFCVGFSLAQGVVEAGLGNVEHAKQLCLNAAEEVGAQLVAKAQRAGWHSSDMVLRGSVVEEGIENE